MRNRIIFMFAKIAMLSLRVPKIIEFSMYYVVALPIYATIAVGVPAGWIAGACWLFLVLLATGKHAACPLLMSCDFGKGGNDGK